MRCEILNDDGEVINTIIAPQEFGNGKNPNHYRFIETSPTTDDINSSIIEEILSIETEIGINRVMREFMVAQPTCPDYIKERDAEIRALRNSLNR